MTLNEFTGKLKKKFREKATGLRNSLNLKKYLRSIPYHLHLFRLFGRRNAKLHLGCGNNRIEGFINIDASLFTSSDIISKVEKLKFSDNSVDTVYCAHLFEHFPRKASMEVLKEWRRVLSPGGKLLICVPDIENLFSIYLDNLKDYGNENKRYFVNKACNIIYGGQTNRYDFHFYGYSFPVLRSMLASLGFTEIKIFKPEDFSFLKDEDALEIMLDNRLLSLNIVAQK